MFRTNVYTAEAVDKKTGNPTGKPKKIWALGLVLLVELIGTFLMVFEIIAPSALNLEQFTWYNQVFGTYLMKAFWVAGFILILIFLLRWCSVNLNPAVTLAEVATGYHTKQRAFWMIIIQFVGAFGAAYAAYWMGANMEMFNTATASTQYIDGTFTLDAVFPRLILSANEQAWLAGNAWFASHAVDGVLVNFSIDGGITSTFNLWGEAGMVDIASTDLLFILITFGIEVLFTWLLLWSVVGAKKVSHNARPFLIFAVLMVVVTLGIHTNNIALNPARLLAPSVVSEAMGGAHTLQYQWIFLLGELAAVAIVARTEGKRAMRAAKKSYKETGILSIGGATVTSDAQLIAIKADEEAFKAEIKEVVLHIQEDLEITKARYAWVLGGNDPIETMDLEEVTNAIKAKKAHDIIDLDQPVQVLRVEFAKFLGFGKAQYIALNKRDTEETKVEEAKKAAPAKKEAPAAKADAEVEADSAEVKDAPAPKAAPTRKAPALKKAPTKK